ncbi:unnamed protein product [Urochloa decumbens]|uniref:UDENN domain-containing protein n=1 Tax=Urochloa decumbens TaxID=240449 RepID=A0ABC8WU56_9POAL
MNRIPSVSLRGGADADAAAASAPPPDPAALARWARAFCVIRFDLERGQLVEACYPPDALAAAGGGLDRLVAFSSFPDSMSHHLPRHRSSVHDSLFSFRVPDPSSPRRAFLYGFVFNRQRQDERLPRGGEQKSVVILSHAPYSSLFRLLLQILGPLCFDVGPSALAMVASHVAAWPAPAPGRPMELPIGSAALRVHLPPAADDPGPPPALLPANPSVPYGLFHDADLFAAFRGLLLHLWTLWELMVVGEPVLVVAPSPAQCSEAVAGLVSLVAPLLYSVDYRPYFTIHDPDFARLNALAEGEVFPPMVLGVTNLFFLKSLKSIPNVVAVGSPNPNSTRVLPVGGQLPGNGTNGTPGKLKLDKLAINKFSPTSLLNSIKLRREGPLSLMTEHKEALWSTYAPTTKPDTSVLNRLIDAGVSPRIEESMSVVNNEILRRHFLELTTNFLAPFGPYLRTTTPSEGSSPFVDPPLLPPFHADEFVNGLAARGPGKFLSKRMRSNWLDLYRRFLEGPNFMPWFRQRRAAAEQEQQRLWRQARINVDIEKLMSKMSELERIDSFNAVEQYLLREMENSGRGNADSVAACQKLKEDLQAAFSVLPKDMQQLLLSNPKRAVLLQGVQEKAPGANGIVTQTSL